MTQEFKTFPELVDFATSQLVEGITKGTALRSSVWQMLDLAARFGYEQAQKRQAAEIQELREKLKAISGPSLPPSNDPVSNGLPLSSKELQDQQAMENALHKLVG